MEITYDHETDAAYLYFSAEKGEVDSSTEVATPVGVEGSVVLDWKDGKLIGIEVLGARKLLGDAMLEGATSRM